MSEHTKTWPELAIGLFEKLNEREAIICYEFEDMTVHVPSGTGEDSTHALWIIDGTLRISTESKK